MNLEDPITSIKGIGSVTVPKFRKLGIETVGDLINYYPRKYDDYTQVDKIANIKPGIVTIKGIIKPGTTRYVRRGLNITEAIASDDSGSVRLIWFNQPYRAGAIDSTKEYYIRGDFGLRRQKLSILNPSTELVSDFPIHSARIVPSYRATKGLKSSQIRKSIASLISEVRALSETLPGWLVQQQGLIGRAEALEKLHYPNTPDDITAAERRLGFEEVFQLSLAALLNKYASATEKTLAIPFVDEEAKQFVQSLPFSLTDGQRQAIWQIYKDLQKTRPMNRLLEGDVGSGKTVVACMAALMVMRHGLQVCIMAPTEILARQHAETMAQLLAPMGYNQRVVLMVGSMSTQQKKHAAKAISDGKAGLIIGTTALIQDNITMKNLALTIVDEQHRFGVGQRKALQAKAGQMPHVLSMTATPIPRSLALTLYGELDISVLSEKPRSRKPIVTKIISPNSIKQMYSKINAELDAKRQAYIVCPVIEESDDELGKPVTRVYEELCRGVFKHRRVGLLHGKLKSDEKEKVMRTFKEGKIDVLVSTTVIEVGVDVPNASVMVIENPEAFGLAQIHQLRGRIGRGEAQGNCFLVLSDSSAPSRRLQALESTQDGFKLAELDLQLRGPGAIYGVAQHGELDLRVAKLSDTKLIAAARNAAQEFIDKKEKLLQYKELANHVQKLRSITNLN